jgi:hypothetical protein
MKKTFLAAAVAVLLGQNPAVAQDVPWRAVIGDNSGVTVPGLPAANRGVTDELLGDLGKGYVGVRITSPDTAQGYWAMKQGSWTQYTKYGVSSAQGPGRTGADAAHVFLSINSGGSGAGADGQRVFIARAGLASDTTTATWGLWRWDTTKNVEIARGATDDDALGPNLGDDWVFQNDSSTSFQGARAMNGGQVLIDAFVTSPTNATRRYLAKSVPGQPVVPCAMKDSTDRALAPNLTDGDYFDTSWGFGDITVTPDNRVYANLDASNSRFGIWELCSGAPRALIVNNETGARGPDIGIGTAVFSAIDPVHPGEAGSLYLFANFRPTPSDTSRPGLFHYDGTSSKPLAMNDDAGVYGPNWRGTTWNSFDTGSLTSAGEYVAFQAQVRSGDGGNPSGLWRVRAGGTPQLVAMRGINETGPETGRQWDTFYGNAVLANGDIIVQARTQPGSEYALWLLKNDGSPARRILKVGQSVSVPTASGVVQAAVNSYEVPNGAAPYSRGGDGWIGADGSLLISASLATYGSVMITALPSNPIDKIFDNGFDG